MSESESFYDAVGGAETFHRLIAFRHDEPVVGHGDFTMLLPDHETVYAFSRQLDSTALLVLANFSSRPVTVDLPDGGTWAGAELVLGNYGTTEPLANPVTLRPWEARVHRTHTS